MRAPLPHPFVRVPARVRRAASWILLAASFALLLALAALDSGLRTPASPRGIVSFELAGSTARAESILAAWGAEGRARAARSLRLDFCFLAAYAPGLALWCAAASDRRRARGATLAGAGAALAWGQLAAGSLDAIENLALLRTLAAGPAGGWPALATACAVPKFVLVAAGLIYTVGSWFRALFCTRNAR